MERDQPYKAKTGISVANEPPKNLRLNVNFRKYPDMAYMYDKFSDLFNIPKDQFILSNGAENAIKNVLCALRPKSIHWSNPTWGFIDVFCEQFKAKAFRHDYAVIYANEEKKYQPLIFEKIFNEQCDIIYETYPTNNIFYTQPANIFKNNSTCIILDLSYANFKYVKNELEYYFKSCDYDNVIAIGSFDKSHGCGLRFGFAVFSKRLSKAIQMQRENFLNSGAYTFMKKIKDLDSLDQPNEFAKSIEYKLEKMNNRFHYQCVTNNFITVNDTGLDPMLKHLAPYREFDVSGFKLVRYGMPSNKAEYKKILEALM